MSSGQPCENRVRLDADAYRQLHQQVLERDSWRCQVYGVMSNLEVQFRSHSGPDMEENLITLCTACHANLHRSESTTVKV